MLTKLLPSQPHVESALVKAADAVQALRKAEEAHAERALLARIEAEEALKRADTEQDHADRAARVRGRLEDFLA